MQDVLTESQIESIYHKSLQKYLEATQKFFATGDKSASDVVAGVKALRKGHYARCKNRFMSC